MNEQEFMNQIKERSADVSVPQNLYPDRLYQRVRKSKRRKRLAAVSIATSLCLLIGIVVLPSALRPSDAHIQNNAVAGYDELYQEMKRIERKNQRGGWGDLLPGARSSETAKSDTAGAVEDVAPDSGSESLPASSGSEGYSETNTQVKGIDEGDVVKSDGRYLYIARNQNSNYYIEIVSVKQGRLEQVAEIDLAKERGHYDLFQIQELYVSGDTLLALTNAEIERESKTGNYITATGIITFDISDPASPKRKSILTQDGEYESSRLVDGYLYTVSEKNVNEFKKSNKESYVPSNGGEIMKCGDIILPEKPKENRFAVVTAVEVKKAGRFADQKAYLGGSDHLYMSNKNIYLASTSDMKTEIIRLSYRKGIMKKEASGTVPGVLHDQFSMDEKDGMLRLVITENRINNSLTRRSTRTSTNHLYILDQDLKEKGSVRNLADNEWIYSARFIGDTAYFVTFRQVDPLFSVDLSDPENPKVMGALKIPGFSSYLHPYGENLLLGIGIDGDRNGSTGEVKLSMFDISDPYDVKEVHKYALSGQREAEVLGNHKAVLVDAGKDLIGFEAENSYSHSSDSAYYIFGYDTEIGFYERTAYENPLEAKERYGRGQRGFYIGSYCLIADSVGVVSLDMDNGFAQTDAMIFE